MAEIVPISELRKNWMFRSLSAADQILIERFLETGGDIEVAVEKAYPDIKPEQRRQQGKAILGHKYVEELISIAFGEHQLSLDDVRGVVCEVVRDKEATAAARVAAARVIVEIDLGGKAKRRGPDDNIDEVLKSLKD